MKRKRAYLLSRKVAYIFQFLTATLYILDVFKATSFFFEVVE